MQKQLLLLGLLAVCAVQAIVQEADHDADTPVRQAQRAMLAERDAATAKHANEDVLGMRLQAVSEGAEAYPERNQPHARRISGAAQSFTPNDKMCVMCQFLAQRIQMDLVGGVSGVHPGAAPYGGIATSIIAGVAPVSGAFIETEDGDEDLVEIDEETEDEAEAEDAAFLQVEDEAEDEEAEEAEDEESEESDEEADDEADEESEDEDEAEDDSEEESEESEEALIEVAAGGAEEESEAEFVTPQYTEHAAVLLEESADETDSFQSPQYIDAVYQTVAGEEAETDSAEEAEEATAGTADSVEAAFFESSAVTSKAAEAGEWTTPEFTAEAAAPQVATVPAELTALLQTAEEEGEDAWTTPTYSEAQAAAPSGTKSYAKIVVSHDKEQSLIEASAVETVTSNVAESAEDAKRRRASTFAPRLVRSRGARRGGKINRFRTKGADIFHTAKRYRSADAIVPRPRWNRLAPHSPRHMSNRLIAGMALRNAEHVAYDRLEAYCSTRLPESYGKYCRPVLRKFRRITEGLSYGDRVPHVCMTVNLCKPESYATASPHDRLEERTF